MSYDPVLEQTTVIPAEPSCGVKHDVVMMHQYLGSGDDEHGEYDVHKDYDMFVCTRTQALLGVLYPGHMFCVRSDAKEHAFYLSYPLLMGIGHWWFVNLKTDELTPYLIGNMAGEILERYRLPRGAWDEASFLDARKRHSKLVNPAREIPN
jgi:hypothetical protein